MLGRQQRHLADFFQISVNRVILGVARMKRVINLVQVIIEPVEQADVSRIIDQFTIGRDDADIQFLQSLIKLVGLLIGRNVFS